MDWIAILKLKNLHATSDGKMNIPKRPTIGLTSRMVSDPIFTKLKVDLILVLAKHGYPPVDRDEVYREIFEQAENFKKYQHARQG